MKVFELKYSCWDDYFFTQFTHPDQSKTIENFMADVDATFKAYSQGYIDTEECCVWGDSWVCFISEKLSNLGYIPLEKESYALSGHCGSLEDLLDSSLGQAAGKDICEKVIQKNNDFANLEI